MDKNTLEKWFKTGFEFVVLSEKNGKSIYKPFMNLEFSIKEATYQEKKGNKFGIYSIEKLINSKK